MVSSIDERGGYVSLNQLGTSRTKFDEYVKRLKTDPSNFRDVKTRPPRGIFRPTSKVLNCSGGRNFVTVLDITGNCRRNCSVRAPKNFKARIARNCEQMQSMQP